MGHGYIEIGSGETYENQIVSDFTVFLLTGARAINTTIESGGGMTLFSSSLANGVTVNSGGGCSIEGGGVMSGIKVNSGGYFGVAGTTGKAYDVVENGGYVFVSGQVSSGYANVKFRSNTINGLALSKGSATVHSGTIAANTTLDDYSLLQVFSGGIVNGVKLNYMASMDIYGGSVTNAAVNRGGYMYVVSGSANGVQVNSGGYMRVFSSGTAVKVVENGGYVNDDDASVSYVSHTLNGLALSGTSASVHSGTTATGAKITESGQLHVLRGGFASGTVVNSGGTMILFFKGSANKTTVNNQGFLRVDSGSNVANDTTVNAGGSCYVTGTANRTTVNSGGIFHVSSGGTANSVTVNYDGSFHLSSGGTANSVTLNSCGYLGVFSGCTATAVMENGGYVYSEDGANVTYLPNTVSGLVLSGKCATAHSGTTANGTLVVSDGLLGVFSYGVANGTSVGAGGRLWVYEGGLADGFTIGSGAELNVGYGGWITGKMTFEAGATVVAGNYGNLDFDVRQTTAGGAALVNNLSVVPDTFYFSLTIDGTLTDGTYKLATGAAGFDQEVWVTNIVDGWLGSLTVGGPARNFEGHGYTLNLGADNVLSVTVGAAVSMDTKSDIDGNGVSDVMFQYTGGDYQLGFWMNGTNSWKGNGLPHPAEWEVLGAYDMNSNGRADSVLVGNVVVNGVRGAYIGYYADSDDTDANWVNIGYLNNADDIDWKNKVGNLTGNAGKNSIVWYTHELGALGAWTDGTDTWVSIASGFDASWSLIGCGDFTGTGADSVVMSLNGGAQYYAVALNGTFTDLGVSDSGWEIRAIGDFSGDGKDDIVAFHKETGIVAKWADGMSSNWSQLGQLDAKDWFVVGCGDYNGDQKDDLLVRQYSTGMLGYYSAGDTTQWNTLGYGVDMSWTVIA